MPVYVYRGTNRTGGSVTGEQSATNKTELINLLRRQQIKVSKLSEKGKEFSLPTFKAGVNAKDLAVFTRQFSVMIDAGLPLVQCLEILAGQQENKTFESVLTTTRASVEGGTTLSAAMRQHEKVFDALYVNLVEAGEAGGILDTILQRLANYIEKNVKLKRAVKSALVYPVAVLGVAGGVITLLLWKVVPIFATLFLGLGVDLAPTYAHCDGAEQFRREHLRLADFGLFCRPGHWAEALAHNDEGPFHPRRHTPETAADRHTLAQDCCGPVHAHSWNSDFLGRTHPRGTGHHGADGRECRDRKGSRPGSQGFGAG